VDFVKRLGRTRFVMYVFDFGAPVGFRLVTRYPEWIAGVVVRTRRLEQPSSTCAVRWNRVRS
jgi:hypothetical protein